MNSLTIPGELPGLNEIIAAAKSHFGQYSAMKRENTEAVAWCAKASRASSVDRAVVRITWYAATRRRDPDNVMAGTKFVMDGLVMAGVLPGDGWRHVAGIEHDFRIDRDEPRVEVEIIEHREASA